MAWNLETEISDMCQLQSVAHNSQETRTQVRWRNRSHPLTSHLTGVQRQCQLQKHSDLHAQGIHRPHCPRFQDLPAVTLMQPA